MNWKTGTIIYKIGDEADFAYLLEKGEVRGFIKELGQVEFINEKEVLVSNNITKHQKDSLHKTSKIQLL